MPQLSETLNIRLLPGIKINAARKESGKMTQLSETLNTRLLPGIKINAARKESGINTHLSDNPQDLAPCKITGCRTS